MVVIDAETSQIDVLARQVAVLDAQRTALEARQGQQRIDLEDREVHAAFDGMVDRGLHRPGRVRRRRPTGC